MALFHLGKKKEETPSCCCGSAPIKEEPTCACNSCCGGSECALQSIKVLGAGCKTCHAQLENCQAAVKELGMQLEVEYITDMEKIVSYGVMSMPALVINEKVVSMGKTLKTAEIISLLKKLGYC